MTSCLLAQPVLHVANYAWFAASVLACVFFTGEFSFCADAQGAGAKLKKGA